MDFFAENNPKYTRDFAEEITTQGVLDVLDQEGIARAVVLAEYAPKTTGVVTNDFVGAFCNGSDRLIPFGAVCLYDGTDTGIQTERCVKDLGCRGLKLLPTYAHHYPDDPRLMAAYEVAQDLGIPVMFHTGTSIFRGSRIRFGNPLLLDDISEEFPRLTIICRTADGLSGSVRLNGCCVVTRTFTLTCREYLRSACRPPSPALRSIETDSSSALTGPGFHLLRGKWPGLSSCRSMRAPLRPYSGATRREY